MKTDFERYRQLTQELKRIDRRANVWLFFGLGLQLVLIVPATRTLPENHWFHWFMLVTLFGGLAALCWRIIRQKKRAIAAHGLRCPQCDACPHPGTVGLAIATHACPACGADFDR